MSDALKMLSIADLEALQSGDMSKVSTKGLQLLQGPVKPGLIASAGAGLGSGVGRVAMGAQYYLGKGLGALGADTAGDFLVNDAAQGRAKLAAEVAPYKAENPLTTGGAELGAEILSTLPVGGFLGNAATKLGAVKFGNALKTSGFSLGAPAAATLAGKAADIGLRAGGGAAVGAVSAGLVNPEDAVTGAVIGGFAPSVIKYAGRFGRGVYDAVRGNKPGAGKMLAQAMGVTEAELPTIIKALQEAPDSIVDGSKLTVSQALQLKGQNTPGVKMLERIAAGGPGGDSLLKAYANQGTARFGALEKQGAQVYQGAAAQEADIAGNRIGAFLRTQAADDQAAAGDAWKALRARADKEGVMLQLPLDRMTSAMEPLGRGTVGAGDSARAIVREAQNIGTDVLPAITATPQKAIKQGKNLEQMVRAAGGLKLGGSGLTGELRDLGIRESGTTGLINNKSGQSIDLMAEEMYRKGLIPDGDSATLLEALRNGGGRKVYATDMSDGLYASRLESSMGDLPGAEAIPKAIPYAEFQRLRRSTGDLAAKVGSREGGATEAGVLNQLKALISGRVDDAAAGNLLPGESMSPAFRDAYESARGMTRTNAERYKGGDNIASILRKPVGQNYTLGGNEVTNKIWHGGAGLADDVNRLKQVLTPENQRPVMDTLQKFIMTDAASRTTAAGDLAAGLPRYVETRMPGLLAALEPEQFSVLSAVSRDIDNAAAAGNVKGLLGSDTQAKIARAMDGGLLESPLAKVIGGVKGLNLVRDKGVEMVKAYKGKTISQLMADPKAAAKALKDSTFVQRLDSQTLNRLQLAAARSAPVLAAD